MTTLSQVLDTPLGVGQGGANITPHNSNANEFRAVYVGGAGNVKVTGLDGVACIFYACPVGFVIPMAVKVVWDTGTTATLLTGIK